MNEARPYERLSVYLDSLEGDLPEYLAKLESDALGAGLPIIKKQMQSLLRTLLAAKRPERILEVGTAAGFSALFMKECAPEAFITTIENYDKRINMARENFRKYDKDGRIELLAKDAAIALGELKDPYDFIFMDAAKGQYIHFLDDALRLLKVGGIMVSDNVLQGGDVIESRFAIRRRDRTIHARMREYLYELKHNEKLETAILTIGDGAALSVKKI